MLEHTGGVTLSNSRGTLSIPEQNAYGFKFMGAHIKSWRAGFKLSIRDVGKPFTWGPTLLGESGFSLVEHKTRLDSSPRGLDVHSIVEITLQQQIIHP